MANWKDEQGYQEVGWGSSLPGLMNINGYQSQAQKSADSLRQKVMLMRNSQRSLEPQLGMRGHHAQSQRELFFLHGVGKAAEGSRGSLEIVPNLSMTLFLHLQHEANNTSLTEGHQN